jgi:hypothetical protein
MKYMLFSIFLLPTLYGSWCSGQYVYSHMDSPLSFTPKGISVTSKAVYVWRDTGTGQNYDSKPEIYAFPISKDGFKLGDAKKLSFSGMILEGITTMLNVYEEGDYDHLVWSSLSHAVDSKISFPLQEEVPFKTSISSIREGQFNTAASCSLGDSRFVIGGLNLQKHSMDMWSDGKTLYYQVKDGKSVLTSKEIDKVNTIEGGPFFIADENAGYLHFLRAYQAGGYEKRKLPDRVNIGDLIKSGNNPNFGILRRDLTFEYNGKSVDLHTELTGLSLAMDIGVFQKAGLFVLASPSPGNIVFADPTDIESNRMTLNLDVTSQNLVQFHTAGETKHFLAWVEKSSNKIHLFYASELNLPVFKTKIEEMFSPTKYVTFSILSNNLFLS